MIDVENAVGKNAQGKWVNFLLVVSRLDRKKTDTWQVASKDAWFNLGTVKWYAPWRQYSFFPGPSSIFERQCLRDIADFCEARTKDRRPAPSSSTPSQGRHDPPVAGESNLEHARHCARCQDDAKRGPLRLRDV